MKYNAVQYTMHLTLQSFSLKQCSATIDLKTQCNTVKYIEKQCSKVNKSAVKYSTMQFSTVECKTKRSTVQQSTLQCCNFQYITNKLPSTAVSAAR